MKDQILAEARTHQITNSTFHGIELDDTKSAKHPDQERRCISVMRYQQTLDLLKEKITQKTEDAMYAFKTVVRS